jgi:hypothetical protein
VGAVCSVFRVTYRAKCPFAFVLLNLDAILVGDFEIVLAAFLPHVVRVIISYKLSHLISRKSKGGNGGKEGKGGKPIISGIGGNCEDSGERCPNE